MNKLLLMLVIMFFGCASLTKEIIPDDVASYECWAESDSSCESARALSLKRAKKMALLKCVKNAKSNDKCAVQMCRICHYGYCNKDVAYYEKD
jgi:hypothetical protein